jgi:transcriptional regulator with XRE-family HTH domain
MATRERPGDRGKRRGERLLSDVLEEGRGARIAAGLSQEDVARALGLSASRVSRMERGRYTTVPFVVVAQYLSVAGLELSARAYPIGGGLRDIAQVRLVDRLRAHTSAEIRWQTEAPMPIAGDLRAWDAVLHIGPLSVGVDAETRLRDFQAIDRRLALKTRDSGVDHAILLVAATRANRGVLRELGGAIWNNYPISSADALAALKAGRSPQGNAIILL